MDFSDRGESRGPQDDNDRAWQDKRSIINLLSGIPFDEVMPGDDRSRTAPMFDSYCSRVHEAEPISAADRYAALERLSFGVSIEIDSRNSHYMRFRPESSRGIRKDDGNLILLVELLPEPGVSRRAESPYVAALPAYVPMVTSYPSRGSRQNVEGFSSPAGLAVEFNPATEQVVDVKLIMSHDAFSEAMEHLDSAISEIMIWRMRSQFVHSSLLMERSSLIARILSEIERRENDRDALRREGLLSAVAAPAFVLGIADFKKEDVFRTRWWIVVSRGSVSESGCTHDITHLSHSLQENTVTFSRNMDTGETRASVQLESSDPFRLDADKLRAASHLYLLRYRRTVSALGAERALRFLNPDDDRME